MQGVSLIYQNRNKMITQYTDYSHNNNITFTFDIKLVDGYQYATGPCREVEIELLRIEIPQVNGGWHTVSNFEMTQPTFNRFSRMLNNSNADFLALYDDAAFDVAEIDWVQDQIEMTNDY